MNKDEMIWRNRDLATAVREWIALTNYSPEKTKKYNGVGTD